MPSLAHIQLRRMAAALAWLKAAWRRHQWLAASAGGVMKAS